MENLITREMLFHYESWFTLSMAIKTFDSDRATRRAMAASLESLAYFLSFVESGDTILDAGCGASSWVLRRSGHRVTSIDTNRDYQHAVYDLCLANQVNCAEFLKCGIEETLSYDWVFFDYDHVDKRSSYLSVAWSKARNGMYVDDMQDVALRQAVETMFGPQQADPRVIDQYGRWGVMLRRTECPKNPPSPTPSSGVCEPYRGRSS